MSFDWKWRLYFSGWSSTKDSLPFSSRGHRVLQHHSHFHWWHHPFAHFISIIYWVSVEAPDLSFYFSRLYLIHSCRWFSPISLMQHTTMLFLSWKLFNKCFASLVVRFVVCVRKDFERPTVLWPGLKFWLEYMKVLKHFMAAQCVGYFSIVKLFCRHFLASWSYLTFSRILKHEAGNIMPVIGKLKSHKKLIQCFILFEY